ncbi:alpha/beta-hydrolase [Haematococcus lacustris]
MVAREEGTFINARQQKLFRVQYLTQGDPCALVVFHTGIGEHVARYDHVFVRMAAAGLAVYAYDVHGQGKSEPKEAKYRCYVHDFEDLVMDLLQFVQLVLDAQPEGRMKSLPLLSVSQSLGGLVSCMASARNPGIFSGIALHSAAIDVEWTLTLKCQAPLGNCLAGCVPFAKIVPAVRPADMSQDPQVVREYLEDPLNYVDDVKARTGNEVLKGFKAMQKLRSKISVPLYACHGTMDRCTSLQAVKDLLKASSSQDKTLNEIPGGYHELLMGPEKEACIQRLVDWLVAHSVCAPGSVLDLAVTAGPAAGSTAPQDIQLAVQ